jgi:hypothetical protein
VTAESRIPGIAAMAETSKGKKIVPVQPYTRRQDGENIQVKRHDRSTPNTSKGKK